MMKMKPDSKPRKLKPTTAWMAFSWAGYPALYVGCFSFAGQARAHYENTYSHTLASAGYRLSRVRIAPLKPKPRQK